MEPMTPEERFTKIENAIEALIETQAQHNVGIRDLIVVSRTLLESQKTILESQKTVLESQKQVTEQIGHLTEKIDRLTDNIDKLIRGRGPNGQA
jgi:hypothetical protein